MSCFQSMHSIVAVANMTVNRYSECNFESVRQTQCMETMSKRLGRLLDRCTAERGTSRRQIALSVGVVPSHLSDMANGNRDPEKLAVGSFMALCAELSTTPEYLFYGQGDEMDKAQSGKEAQLLMLFRAVPEDRRDMLIDMIRAAAHSGNGEVA